jgi:hypothetical protein
MFKSGTGTEFLQFEEGDLYLRQTAPGALDTRMKQGGNGAKYYGQQTSWVEDGEFLQWPRTAPLNQTTFSHAPTATGAVRMVCRPIITTQPSMVYEELKRWSAVRIDNLSKFPGSSAAGLKVAWMLFEGAPIGTNNYSEDDFPEFQLGGAVGQAGFFHHQSSDGKEKINEPPGFDATQWHLYTTVAVAKGHNGHPTGYREFYLDGQLLLRCPPLAGVGTHGTHVTDDDVYYNMQTESNLMGSGALPQPHPQGIIRTRLLQVMEPV